MNTFLNDLVTLNKIILDNAREQFPDAEAKRLRYRAAPATLAEDLAAEVCTEIVSGKPVTRSPPVPTAPVGA